MIQITTKIPDKIKDELEKEWGTQVETFPTMSDYLRSIIVNRKKAGVLREQLNKANESLAALQPNYKSKAEIKSNESEYDKLLEPIYAHVKSKHIEMVDMNKNVIVHPINSRLDLFKAILYTIKFNIK